MELRDYLIKKYEKMVKCDLVEKHDLDMVNTKRVHHHLFQANHLVGSKKTYLKLFFNNFDDLKEVRKVVAGIVKKNQSMKRTTETYWNELP